ncbi:hypothetical protein QYE80_08075 [Pseudomonas tohonis]|nr:hypothetical protein L682_27340 [Pseudomonas alcaligenes OT 69]MDN4144931.1 hypothetical protein [Pseudomonas tohonis]
MQRFINNWSAILLQPAAAADTEIVIAPELAAQLDGLGAGDHYVITLAQRDETGNETAWEIVRATARAAGTLTVLRQQEGTVAPTFWPVGTLVSIRLTRDWAESILLRLAALESPPEFALSIGVGADSETSDRGFTLGGGYGTCTPASFTLQDFGEQQLTIVVFFGDDFYLEFSGNQVPQAALASVEVEGVGTLLGSVAGYGYDSGAQSTWFQWDGVGNVWPDGESRTVTLRFNL